MSAKIEIPREQLYQMYVAEGMSSKEISRITKHAQCTIRRELQKHGIPMRNRIESMKTPRYRLKIGLTSRRYSEEYYQVPQNYQKGQRVSGKALGFKRIGTYIWVVCPICEEGRWVYLGNTHKVGFTGLCCHCHPKLEQQRKAISQSNRRRNYRAPVYYEKLVARARRLHKIPEIKARRIETLKKTWAAFTPNEKKERMEGLGNWLRNPENRDKIKEMRRRLVKESWANYTLEERSERLKKFHLACNRRPNKPERYLMNLLNFAFPGEWKYTGDGQVIIGGRIPDVMNCNSKKQLIELFGDYFHSEKCTGRSEKEDIKLREETYAKFGYSTLVIWERELKNPAKVLAKIVAFTENRKESERCLI